MNKSLEIKTALRNQFKEGTSKMAKRVCYGYLQDENGNLKKSAVRWNPYAEDLIADDWELAEYLRAIYQDIA